MNSPVPANIDFNEIREHIQVVSESADWNRLREAYHIIKDTKDEVLDLRSWSCGTLACAAGHLGRNPKFNSYGLTMKLSPEADVAQGDADSFPILFAPDIDGGKHVFCYTALCYVFNIPDFVVHNLFGPRLHLHEADGGTDREVWLKRCELLFKVYDKELQ